MKTVITFEADSSVYTNSNLLTFSAPFRWLKKGWRDFRRATFHSLSYGTFFVAIGWLLVYVAQTNGGYFLPTLFMVMLLVGPALAFGLYDVSRELEHKHRPSFSHERKKVFSEMGHELMLSLMMTVIFMFIIILASLVTNILAMPWQAGVTAALPMSDTTFLVVAVVFAGLLFSVNSFALPMILDKDATAGTATTTSLNAVWKNKSVMALWALLVVALMAVGFATYLLAFFIIIPVLGYASWHAYRETIVIE
ncbi:MAG: DUF2189 domain-containing protein [Gammaproteobacteria bacterium]|nr:DUF2189 domain-containing protein [Gammaproteobacteria bacterium]